MTGSQDITSFYKLPIWLKICLILGVIILAVLIANRDLDRERSYLEELCLQKGEISIRSLSSASMLFGWENLNSEETLSKFSKSPEGQENFYFVITDMQGEVKIASIPLEEVNPEVFQNPDPFTSFVPPKPHWRIGEIGGKNMFWVFRPLWFTFEIPPVDTSLKGSSHPRSEFNYPPKHAYSTPQDSKHHSGQIQAPTEETPKVFIPPKPMDPTKVRYCWVGFDMAPFEASERAAKLNTTIFIGLITLAGLAGLMALFWAQSSRLTSRLYQDTKARSGEIISRLPIGLVINDNEGRVTLVNQAALKISGLKESDFMGKKLSTLTFGAFPQDEELWGLETDVSFQGGSTSRLSITAGPVLGHDGTKLGRVVLLSDLGELGRLKAELAQKEKLATIGNMARTLAHEIRNPLGAIKGLTQHLLGKSSESSEKEALEVILASVERLAGTITDFLDYARPTNIKPAPLALGAFLKKMNTLIIHDAVCENVNLDLKLPPQEVEILADDTFLAQAFLNLYINSLQATRDSGAQDGSLTVTLAPGTKGEAIVTIADNGPGFGEAQLSHPFVPYFTSKARGSGLGLVQVKKIIEAHEGQILLGNQESGGALVTVVLPLIGQGDLKVSAVPEEPQDTLGQPLVLTKGESQIDTRPQAK
ncbi:MAG: PAS domain S-box protein [Deltaproteobacteria bacterium]|jgi:two-component system sensor histidine kinase HydH|nr:PAS domain S-box protein [Deltaproteobacteria bacterium]